MASGKSHPETFDDQLSIVLDIKQSKTSRFEFNSPVMALKVVSPRKKLQAISAIHFITDWRISIWLRGFH
ncbi:MULTISPECIES: hypothetical protein [unclassified Synechococcus]|uniref:hypothetical protein n=1 Tax=unclassified Synechococcus TaxID=2626047 RepID=UPI0012E981C9|nr:MULTISPECIES: hypothetical protein [unclassified Synechococcus]